jgi:hypothetical protein
MHTRTIHFMTFNIYYTVSTVTFTISLRHGLYRTFYGKYNTLRGVCAARLECHQYRYVKALYYCFVTCLLPQDCSKYAVTDCEPFILSRTILNSMPRYGWGCARADVGAVKFSNITCTVTCHFVAELSISNILGSGRCALNVTVFLFKGRAL